MSASEVQRLKVEIEKQEKALNELWRKWDEESAIKRLSMHDRAGVIKAVVSAKRLATVLIPRLMFKIDLALRTPTDKKLQEIAFGEWNTIRAKVDSTLREFELLETGKKPEYPSKEQRERDRSLSKNIEKCLKGKGLRVTDNLGSCESSSTSFHFAHDGSGDMGKGQGEFGSVSEDFGTEEESTGGNTQAKIVDDLRIFKEQLKKGRESKETFSDIVQDVCPEDVASVKEYIRSLAASKTLVDGQDILSQEMLDEIRGLDDEEATKKKEERREKMAKSKEAREERIQRIEKLAKIEPVPKRPILPSPLPIDGFLNLVEKLPTEIQELVSKETEALSDYHKEQFLSKNRPISHPSGNLISMNKLRREYQDDRFDASDFHIRAPQPTIADEHLKKLKEHKVDNAVGRFFGTFSSKFNDYYGKPSTSSGPDDEDTAVSFDGV